MESAEQWMLKGERLLAGDEYEGAVDAFSRAIALHPSARLYLSRSFAYTELGNSLASLQDCERAVELEPGNEAAIRTRDRALADLKGDHSP